MRAVQCKMCTVQWCQVRSDGAVQTALKKEAYAENFNIIGRKLKKRWQMCFRAGLRVSPFKNTGSTKNTVD